MRRTMESVAAERLNKIGIRDHNMTNGSASENENTSAGTKYFENFFNYILISRIFSFTIFHFTTLFQFHRRRKKSQHLQAI